MRAVVAICVLFLVALAVAGSGQGESQVAAPVVVTGSAQPGDWFAFLNGSVDPGGLETRAWFEWGPTPALGSSTSVEIVEPCSPAMLTARIVDLESFTTYYFRIVAANASGTGVGETVSFGTLDTVPPPNPPPPKCNVPRVVGRTLAVARQRIGRAGCTVKQPIRFVRSGRRRGIVLSQFPRGGTVQRRHAAVRLVVSRGKRA